MSGKDIFLGLRYVEARYIQEAEFGRFPVRKTETASRRAAFRRPFLVAALIALAVLLAGCMVCLLPDLLGYVRL